MTAKAFAAIAAAIVIVAMVLPGAAAAQNGTKGHQDNPTVLETFSVRGSNGFFLGVKLLDRQALSVSAITFDGPSIVASEYKLQAQQPRGTDVIVASLGKVGRIGMRFVPESVHEEEPLLPICKGEMDTVEEGHFVGRFEFHGEHGYTRAQVKRAPGSVTIVPAPTCDTSGKHSPHKHGPKQRGRSLARRVLSRATTATKPKVGVHVLNLKVKAAKAGVEFQATRLSAPNKKGKEFAFDTFLAAGSRDRGRIHEESVVLDLLVRGPYFKVPDLTHLTKEVVLEPPTPFLGSASLRRESTDKVSWVGDLGVNLPGFGVVPLAGPDAQVSLCADSGCRSNK